MRKVLFSLVLSFVFIVPVYADCDYQKEAELSRIASNVQISYNYKIQNNMALFDVTLTNLTNDIYVVYDNGSRIMATGEYTLSYDQGRKIKFDFYSNECGNTILLTKYLNLPTYNRFYDTKECQKSPNFKYCKMWDNLDINNSEFLEAYDEYVYVEENNKEELEEKSIYDIIMQAINEYIKEIIIGVIGIIILIIILILKLIRKKK